jgi:hypothetical protein
VTFQASRGFGRPCWPKTREANWFQQLGFPASAPSPNQSWASDRQGVCRKRSDNRTASGHRPHSSFPNGCTYSPSNRRAARERPSRAFRPKLFSAGVSFALATSLAAAHRFWASSLPGTAEPSTPHTPARSGRWRAECLIALTFRIRRAILMPKRLYSIAACLQFQIDVRIGDFVAWRAVSHH